MTRIDSYRTEDEPLPGTEPLEFWQNRQQGLRWWESTGKVAPTAFGNFIVQAVRVEGDEAFVRIAPTGANAFVTLNLRTGEIKRKTIHNEISVDDLLVGSYSKWPKVTK